MGNLAGENRQTVENEILIGIQNPSQFQSHSHNINLI